MKSEKTLKIATRKLSFTKIDKVGADKKECLIGWEYEPPQEGKSYNIFLGNKKVLRTSPVREVTENVHSIIVKTTNSMYRLKYLNEGDELDISV